VGSTIGGVVERLPGIWDGKIVDRIAAGDEVALAEAYDQFGSYVYGLARRVLADSSAAEDITQDVFMQLWREPQRFDPERGTLRSYLGVLTHRRAVDLIRREEAARRRDTLVAEQNTVAPPDIAEAATSMVLAERVRAAVQALPTEQREAVELAYFAGKTFREVAVLLDVPEGTAKSRIRLAMRKLADALQPENLRWI